MFGLRKKDEYVEVVRREVPPFWSSLFFDGYDKKYFEEIVGEPLGMDGYVAVDKSTIYYIKDDIDKFSKQTFDRWHNNPDELKRVKSLLEKREDKIMRSIRNKDFKLFIESFKAFAPALIVGYSMEEILLGDIKEKLESKLDKAEVDNLLDKINIPLKDNFYRKAELDLVATDDITKHVKEYEWINSRYGTIKPYTAEDAKKRLGEIDKEEIIFQHKNQKESTKIAIAEAKEILGKDSHIIDLMQFMVFYRTHRTEVINKAIYYATPMLKALAKEKGLKYKEIIHCTNKEVLNNSIPELNIIKERIKGCSYIGSEEKFNIFIGEDNQNIKDFFKKNIENVSKISGNVATAGKVKGLVRIIMNHNDFSKFQDGDVLVTSMTTPDFVPIMKKAIAFVTNEGGITCHAAIVSREMKKPCIIGTKIATEALKDEDEVEVDANVGIVRIINKAENINDGDNRTSKKK